VGHRGPPGGDPEQKPTSPLHITLVSQESGRAAGGGGRRRPSAPSLRMTPPACRLGGLVDHDVESASAPLSVKPPEPARTLRRLGVLVAVLAVATTACRGNDDGTEGADSADKHKADGHRNVIDGRAWSRRRGRPNHPARIAGYVRRGGGVADVVMGVGGDRAGYGGLVRVASPTFRCSVRQTILTRSRQAALDALRKRISRRGPAFEPTSAGFTGTRRRPSRRLTPNGVSRSARPPGAPTAPTTPGPGRRPGRSRRRPWWTPDRPLTSATPRFSQYCPADGAGGRHEARPHRRGGPGLNRLEHHLWRTTRSAMSTLVSSVR
jgi:hypothetical protein